MQLQNCEVHAYRDYKSRPASRARNMSEAHVRPFSVMCTSSAMEVCASDGESFVVLARSSIVLVFGCFSACFEPHLFGTAVG
ncbi:MAG: hypothetical protein DWI10_07090 [Planctomycetota bacterium]|nr:MAG: hypothetical protein DWI10_07090 [Planctomycetota bacterium]